MNTYSQQVGGTGGEAFGPIELPAGARLTEITVFSGDFIDGIEITYKPTPRSKAVTLPLVGGRGGEPATFALATGETLTGITGRSGYLLDSVQFHTTKGSSEVFGGGGGQPFAVELNDGEEFAGLVGRAGWFIDALGLVVRPAKAKAAAKPKKATTESSVPHIVALPDPDDFKKIAGIGPKIEKLIQSAGITTFDELAKATLKSLRAVLEEAGTDTTLADPKAWRTEAKKLAAEKKKNNKAA